MENWQSWDLNCRPPKSQGIYNAYKTMSLQHTNFPFQECYPSSNQFIFQFVCLSNFIHFSICVFVCLSNFIHFSICLFVCAILFVCLFIFLFVCLCNCAILFVCLEAKILIFSLQIVFAHSKIGRVKLLLFIGEILVWSLPMWPQFTKVVLCICFHDICSIHLTVTLAVRFHQSPLLYKHFSWS